MYITYHSDTVHRHIHNRVKLEAIHTNINFVQCIYEITVRTRIKTTLKRKFD